MKLLSLVLRRIRSYFADNKLVFLLYFLGSVMAGLLLIYTYGNLMPYKEMEAGNQDTLRKYTAELVEPVKNVDTQKLMDAMQGYGLQRLELRHNATFEQEGAEDIPITISAEITGQNPRYKTQQGRVVFTKDEEQKASPVIVTGYFSALEEDATRKIDGTVYKVIGAAVNPEDVIPYSTFQKMQYTTEAVMVMPEKILSIADSNALVEKLSKLFPGAAIQTPKDYYKFAQGSFIGGFINMLGMYIVAIVALLLLASYMLRRYDKENMVQRRVGCSRGKCVAVSVLSNMLTALAAAGLAVLIHASCYQSFFAKISINDKIAYYPIDYLMLTLLVVAVTTCACIPFCLRGLSRSVVGAKANT